MSESFLLGLIGGMISGAAAHSILQARLRARRRARPSSWKDVELDRFSGMSRLLEGGEAAALRSLPAFGDELANRLESGRRHVLRMYLREFEASFQTLFGTALDYALNDPDAPVELAESLLAMRRRIWVAVPAARLYLAARELGVPYPKPAASFALLDIAPRLLRSAPAIAAMRA